MKRKNISAFTTVLMLTFMFIACNEQENELEFPFSADIFYSIEAKQVAFSALTHSAASWNWDFGDGSSSTEQNPVHIYDVGGYYVAKLTAVDAGGSTIEKEVKLAIELTPYALLTGDYTVDGYNGKTWKLSASHSVNDILANSDASFSLLDDDIEFLPTGAFDMYLGLPEAYNDEFTFYYNGDYRQSTTDGSSIGGIAYALTYQQMGLTSITKTGDKAVFGADVFALTTFTPEDNVTFVLNEKEDYVLPTIPDYATSILPQGIPVVTYPGVMTLEFSGTSAFVGLRDFHRKVIVQHISDNSMRLAMFLTLSPDAIMSLDPLIALSTTAVVLTFSVVN